MTIIRGLVILVSVFLLAPIGQASAQAAAGHAAGLSQSNVVLAGDVMHPGRCPRLCVEWFDGCNTCSCGKGSINACTELVCRWHRRPRCLRYGF
jgi:hypothetical protein